MKSFATFLAALLALCFTEVTWAASTSITINGAVSYQVNSNSTSVKIEVENVRNESKTQTSGTLHLTLWATSGPSPVASGYQLADVNLGTFASNNGQLAPGAGYTNIVANASFTAPPNGTYYIHLLVSEYPNLDTILDSVTFNGTKTFAAPIASVAPIAPASNDGGGGSLDVVLVASLLLFCWLWPTVKAAE